LICAEKKKELDKLRAKREQEEKERKKFEDKERVRQEEELKRKEEELKRKEDNIKRKETKELLSRAVMIQHPCINLKIKIPKGMIPSLHSTLSSINSFVLVLSKIVFPPSFIISNSSKDFSKPNFDIELPFRFQLSQSENRNFCEMGRLSHFSKLSSRGDGPFKIIKKINDNAYQLDRLAKYGVHPTLNITYLVPFTSIMDDEDDHQDLRANPLQWGGDDVTPQSPIAPSGPSPSPSPLKGPITRNMMKKIQMGLPIDGQKSNGLVTLFSWAKEINKT